MIFLAIRERLDLSLSLFLGLDGDRRKTSVLDLLLVHAIQLRPVPGRCSVGDHEVEDLFV